MAPPRLRAACIPLAASLLLLQPACGTPPKPASAANCPPSAAADQGQAGGQHHPPSHSGGQHSEGGQHHGRQHHGSGPLVHRFKEDAAAWAKRFEGPARDKSQKPAEVVAAMAIKPGARVADVGTGTGYFVPHLSAAVGPQGEVIAADIEPGMIRYVKARAAREQLPNVSPRLVLVDDPLLPSGALDRILIVNTWHHIPNRIAYARKLREALVDGGSVWIIDFKMSAPKGPDPKHRLLPTKVAEELTAAGLSVRIDEALLPNQYIAIGTRVADGS